MGGIYLSAPPLSRAAFVLVESALLALALILAIAVGLGPGRAPGYELLLPRVAVVVLVLQVCLYYAELYDDRALRSRMHFFLALGQSMTAAILLLSLVYYLVPALTVGRGILLLYLPLATLTVASWHSLHRWMAGREALSDTVLIMGTGQTSQQIAMEMLRRAPFGYRIAGFLGEHPAEVGRRLVNPSIIGTTADLLRVVDELKVSLIVVALEDRRGKMPVADLLRCRLAGIRVEEAPSFFERLTGKILVSNLRPSWLVFSPGFSKPRLLRTSKRVAESLAALTILLLAAPLLGLVALLIRLESRGPVLYRQKRVGEGGQTFELYKLRTMLVDAESETGPVWASSTGDPRITRVGRLLRKARLDELPQLINVLRGEMSFVGPRPERPHFVEQLRRIIPYYDERHSVKPGITGWAQIRFGYGSTIEDSERKLQFDLYYIKNMSFLFDLGILLDTVKVVLFGRGAR